MFAIIRTGGKQYKVEKGLEIWVEKLEQNEGDVVEFNDVLLVCNDSELKTAPGIKATVSGRVVKQNRRKKNSGVQAKTPQALPPYYRASPVLHSGSD